MSDEVKAMMKDPMFAAGYNEGLEWAANWITGALSGYSEETVQFATANAGTIRAVKLPIEQQDFFDAIRADPCMKPDQKEYWLSLEPKGEQNATA